MVANKALANGKHVQILEWHGKKFLTIKVWKFLIEIRLKISFVGD